MKSNQPKRQRSDAELKQALAEQLSALLMFCHTYDAGHKNMAPPASTILRSLLHMPKRESSGRALLESLGMRNGLWRDLSFANLVPVIQPIDTCLLVAMQASAIGPEVIPAFEQHSPRIQQGFKRWWEDPIAHSQQHGAYSRRDIVTYMADMEGAHVDTGFPERYIALRDGTFVSNVQFISPGCPPRPFEGLHTACLRHIAHELIITLHERDLSLLQSRYHFRYRQRMVSTKLPGDI